MKLRITKFMIAAVAIFLLTAAPTGAKAQFAQNTNGGAEWTAEPPKMSNSGSVRSPFAEDVRPPSYAPPPGGGDGQKLPVHGGFWLMIGLAISYGIVRRNHKVEETV